MTSPLRSFRPGSYPPRAGRDSSDAAASDRVGRAVKSGHPAIPRQSDRRYAAAASDVSAQIVLGKAHHLGLILGRGRAQVTLAGEFDYEAAADLDRLLSSLDRLEVPVDVDMSEVTFIDSHGIRPLVEATRRRRSLGLPAVHLVAFSNPVRRLLQVSGLGGAPHLDVQAWDRLNQLGSRWISGGLRRLPPFGPPC